MNPKAASAVFFHIGLQMRYQMKLKLTHDEVRVLVFALNELRNSLIAENRYTDPVDEILARLIA